MEILKAADAVLEREIRPLLRAHGGDITVRSFEGGELTVKMAGGCAGCPSAKAEMEEIAAAAIRRAVPGVETVRVTDGVSGELLDAARAILSRSRPAQNAGGGA